MAIRTGWAASATIPIEMLTTTSPTGRTSTRARVWLDCTSRASPRAARLLRDRGVVGVCVDTMALDGPVAAGALRELLQRDARVVANANLKEELPARGARMTVAPLLVGAPEAPCRLCAAARALMCLT